MFNKLVLGAVAALLVAIVAIPTPALSSRGSLLELEASQGSGTVVVEKVLDGDTVIVRGWRERVRLANIDAPEMSHGYGKPGQPYSVQASRWLTQHVEGKKVSLRCVDEDRYGRKVCDLFQGTEHINKSLVRAGLAWANTANPRYLRDRSVLAAQEAARSERLGLWAGSPATPPWEWRKACWERGSCS